MSAVPPIAPEFVHCNDSTKSAKTGREQMQQTRCAKARLLDHLGGGGLQRQRYSEAERLGSLEIDDQFGRTSSAVPPTASCQRGDGVR
jgi:hypothetical protein